MKYVMFIIGLSLGCIAFGFLIYSLVKFIRRRPLGGTEPKIEGKDKYLFIVLNAVIGLFTILSTFGCAQILEASLSGGEIALIIFGAYFFGSGFSLLFSSFVLYYYKPDLFAKQRKIARIVLFSSIPFIVGGLWMFTNGLADHLTYPLWSGLSFTEGFTTPIAGGGFIIKFYGVVIVGGAIVSYFISDHYFYKKFHKHSILDTLLLVAFPAGIVGGRLWYCLILEPGTNIFDIRNGGMAIQGGALFGIVFGALFMIIFRRYVNLRWAMDIVIPTILIAQVIGRWGNFFNQEVYGGPVPYESIAWLPKMVVNNMFINGEYRLPLFLIEGVINLAGYFIIRYAVGKGLRKWLSLGDIGMSYVIWYGLVRVCLEPLRNSSFEYNQSWITAFVMIGVGVLGIVAFHVYDYIRKVKGLPPKNLDTI